MDVLVVKGNRGGGKTYAYDIFEEFCKWSPEHAAMVVDFRSWGSTSIVVWLDNGMTYKVKRYAPNKFIMQVVSEEDIKKKYELNK